MYNSAVTPSFSGGSVRKLSKVWINNQKIYAFSVFDSHSKNRLDFRICIRERFGKMRWPEIKFHKKVKNNFKFDMNQSWYNNSSHIIEKIRAK